MVMNKLWQSVLFFVSLYLLSMVNIASANEIDKIVAIVNSDIIMMSEVQKRSGLLRKVDQKARALPQPGLMKAALEELVLERLQIQQAKERGIVVDDVTLNRAIERVAQRNKMGLGQFRQALGREGINYNDYREQIRNKMISEALRKRQVDRRIRVSDQEVEDLIISQSSKLNRGVRYNLQHILISAPAGTSVSAVNAAKKRAEGLRKSILKGQDFTAVAKANSDSNAAANGGQLGWQSAEKLPVSFVRALSLLEAGGISEVVRDPKGFHILKLIEKQGGQQQSGDHLKIKAEEFLGNRKLEEEYMVWLQRLKDEAYIEYRPPFGTGINLK
jgi:peptidyl-prolyl cis-trans isomerase SurA